MIVDDMPIFLEYLRGCIDWNAYGFEICCEAHDGREALQKMEEYLPDVVLTDITMPYLNGLELSEKIIKDYPDTAVVLITGNNEFEYARKAVKIGVCDYIVKPFENSDLLVRIEAILRRIGRRETPQEPKKLTFKDIEIDSENHIATVSGNELDLTRKEFDILELMIRNPKKVFTKDNIYESIWGESYIPEDNTVNVHVSNIRKKLEALGSEKEYVKTVWGIGFKMSE